MSLFLIPSLICLVLLGRAVWNGWGLWADPSRRVRLIVGGVLYLFLSIPMLAATVFSLVDFQIGLTCEGGDCAQQGMMMVWGGMINLVLAVPYGIIFWLCFRRPRRPA
ncbi:MAG: hypothetical protein EAZ30_16625 [Betaproteobacteria bacterium]|nr:MAG: hypothetical protein EAZ43_04895 [Betaproteobacteria bacterium]TAG44902.1 MAG: hypothetical protein EAZ30_16625 [Betaproteobacteria bacterium]